MIYSDEEFKKFMTGSSTGPDQSDAETARLSRQPVPEKSLTSKVVGAIQPAYQAFDAAKRGAQQGITAGWSDEIVGAAKAIGSVITLAASKRPDESLGETYRRFQQGEQQGNKQAESQNPAIFKTAEFASSLVPTAVASRFGKPGLTALGGAAAAGYSDNTIEKNPGALAADTAVGMGLGYGAGAVAQRAGTKPADVGAWKNIKDSTVNASMPKTEAVSKGIGTVGGGTLGFFNTPEPITGVAGGAWAGGKAGETAGKGIAKVAGAVSGAVESMPAWAGLPIAAAGSSGNTDPLMDWVRKTMGLNTPAGQENMSAQFKEGLKKDEEAVRRGEKDGRPDASVPNIVVIDGKSYNITPNGTKVQTD